LRTIRCIALVTVGIACVTVAAASAAPAAAPKLEAPSTAPIGSPVTISATGLKPGVFYRATLDQAPAAKRPGLACVRNIDQPFHVGRSDRTYVWHGHVPSTLRCHNTHTNKFARAIALTPGTYRWIVGRKSGRASWDPRASLLIKHVHVTKASR
jgi:hypothetical protein